MLLCCIRQERAPAGRRISNTRRHRKKSALAELRRTAGALESVLLSF